MLANRHGLTSVQLAGAALVSSGIVIISVKPQTAPAEAMLKTH